MSGPLPVLPSLQISPSEDERFFPSENGSRPGSAMNINTNVRPFSELDSYVSKISGHHSPSDESIPN